MMKRALDLFCGAGGASAGLIQAGFEVTGIDIDRQPNYPFKFLCGDALAVAREISGYFNFIWASPPCQAFTAYKRRPGHVKPRPNLIPEVRRFLKATGMPYVIENVGGAPLLSPTMLCGSMFGLDVRRHRFFESNFEIVAPPCRHDLQTPRFPQATNRKNLRSTVEVGVYRIPLAVQRLAMGIDWMRLEELSEAIPPAYANWIGRHAIKELSK